MGTTGRKVRRRVEVGQVGEWTFFEVTGHSFTGDLDEKPLYEFEVAGDGRTTGREMYLSLDHALVAAVGEKWTGPRGAGGSGVGTAADWFMAMIGADRGRIELTEKVIEATGAAFSQGALAQAMAAFRAAGFEVV